MNCNFKMTDRTKYLKIIKDALKFNEKLEQRRMITSLRKQVKFLEEEIENENKFKI